jgi:hypothetical protein
MIVLVEDNASDEKLTVLAFKQCGVANQIIVMRLLNQGVPDPRGTP